MKVALGFLLVVAVAALGFVSLPKDQVLAGYTTSLGGRTRSQRHNSVLALEKLNRVLIPAGAEFSFNRAVGTFSRDAGYRKAPVSFNGQLIDDWGGGVCQTSTTVYNAALLAGLEILERNRHRFAPSYVPPGRDAAVAFSNIDLRFRNPHPFPIRLKCTVEGDELNIMILADRPLRNKPVVLQHVRNVIPPAEFRLGSGTDGVRRRNTGKAGFSVQVVRITDGVTEVVSEDEYPAMASVVEYRR